MNKQELEAAKGLTLIIALPIVLAVAFAMPVASAAWEGYWIVRILEEMHAAYGWRMFSLVECAVASMILQMVTAQHLTKREIEWKGLVGVAVAPIAAYWSVLLLIWWSK